MTESKVFAVYIMTNRKRGVLYVGVTSNLENRATQHREGALSNLENRATQHREGALEGFTKRYNLRHLVWYRAYGEAIDAISFEKQLKRWRREWKFRLIEETNPGWVDLWPELMGLDLIGPLSHLQGR